DVFYVAAQVRKTARSDQAARDAGNVGRKAQGQLVPIKLCGIDVQLPHPQPVDLAVVAKWLLGEAPGRVSDRAFGDDAAPPRARRLQTATDDALIEQVHRGLHAAKAPRVHGPLERLVVAGVRGHADLAGNHRLL